MNHILLIVCVLIIFINIPQISTQEGFNSYFRQTMRPHFRTVKGFQSTTMGDLSIRLANIGRILGIS